MGEEDYIKFEERPSLSEPLMILGISGWADAGRISSGSISYLIKALRARKFATISPEKFYNFTKLRPVVIIEEGIIRSITFPANTFYYRKNPEEGQDCILLEATEPHLNWDDYIRTVLALAKRFSVKRMITIGGVIDEIPHTLTPPVTVFSSERKIVDLVESQGIRVINYVGPSSIHGPLLESAQRNGFQFVSIWGHSPFYIQKSNPSACYRVLSIVKDLTGISFDLTRLMEMRNKFEEELNMEIQKNSELRQAVQTMEKAYREREEREGSIKGEGKKVIEIKAFIQERPSPQETGEDK
jgi:proteasome assembly chaperone (PAC2) family protein